MHFNQTHSSPFPLSSKNDNSQQHYNLNLVSKCKSDHLKRNVTLCHTLYPIAIEARSAVAAVSTGVVFAVGKLGALIPIVRTRPEVV